MSARSGTAAVRGLRDHRTPGRHVRRANGLAQGLSRHQIGGQALPEGVLVRTPSRWAVAIRCPDRSIHTEVHPLRERWPKLRDTVLRGPLALADAVSIGIRALAIAMRETQGVEITRQQLSVTFIPVAIGVVAVFVVAPGLVAVNSEGLAGDLVEAFTRAAILPLYLGALARSEQTNRLFAYHGAEHMAIAAYERHGRVPDPEDVEQQSPVHPRCGTNFIALFAISCGVLFSFITRRPLWAGSMLRVVLVPVVAAVSYEVMRLTAGRQAPAWARAVSWPGRALQRLTTRRPERDQVEVAIASLARAVGA